MRCRRRPANAICALADVFSVPHPIAVHIRVIGRGFGARGRRWVGEARARLRERIRCAVAHGDRTLQHGRRNDPHKQGLHGGLASDTGECHEADESADLVQSGCSEGSKTCQSTSFRITVH